MTVIHITKQGIRSSMKGYVIENPSPTLLKLLEKYTPKDDIEDGEPQDSQTDK